MDRDTALRRLAAHQDRIDYCAKAGRMMWSRMAQNAGRETSELAEQSIRMLEQSIVILKDMQSEDVFGAAE